jgi:hypothetical protein
VNDSKELFNSQGEKVSELDIILQVWQDLNRLGASGLHIEDETVKNVLEQIIISEFKGLPEGYEIVQKKITREQAKAMGVELPDFDANMDINEVVRGQNLLSR